MAKKLHTDAWTVAVFMAASIVLPFATAIAPGGIGVTHAGEGHPVEVPVATFTGETDGLDLHVDASQSYDPFGRSLYYNWFWGDGTGGSGGPANDHTYKKNACNGGPLCNVRLQVTAANETSNGVDYAYGNFTMLAPNTPPSVAIVAPIEDAKLSRNFTVRGTASDADGDDLTVTVTVGTDQGRIATGSENWRLDVENAAHGRGPLTIRAVANDGRAISGAVSVSVVLVAEGEGEDELQAGTSSGSGDIELTITSPEPGSVLPDDFFLLEGALSSTGKGPFELQAKIGDLSLLSSTISPGAFSLEVSTPVISGATQNLTVTVTSGTDQVVVAIPIKGPGGDPSSTDQGTKKTTGDSQTDQDARPAPGFEVGVLVVGAGIAAARKKR